MAIGLMIIVALVAVMIGWLVCKLMVSKRLYETSMMRDSLSEKVESMNLELESKEEEINELLNEKLKLSNELASLRATMEEERKSSQEKLKLLDEAREKLTDAFKALSREVLDVSKKDFLQLAESSFKNLQLAAKSELEQRKQAVESLVLPIKENLEKYHKWLQEVENIRREDYGSITDQLKKLAEMEKHLSQETSNLVLALKAPQVRGNWGEQTLRRVVEMAGLSEHCDFTEQVSIASEGGTLRPDLVVKMPGEREIIVDAKNIFNYYYEAMECQDEVKRNDYLNKHVKAVREHIRKLSQKSYWEQFACSADFVVFFMPNENLYIEAIKRSPDLFEEAIKQRILLAHPMSLVGFLRVIALTWKQQKMSESSEKIRDLGEELYNRIVDLTRHIAELGKHLSRTVVSYNKTVGSVKRRVLVTTRKMKELGVSGKDETRELSPVDNQPLDKIVYDVHKERKGGDESPEG